MWKEGPSISLQKLLPTLTGDRGDDKGCFSLLQALNLLQGLREKQQNIHQG
jgi:hypothetical protein